MSEFTPGKWTYDHPNGVVHREGKLIAEVAGAGGTNYLHDKGQANARLIAAAPEMYSMLISAMASLRDGGIPAKRLADEIEALLDIIDGEQGRNA